MSDDADHAQEIEQLERDQALARLASRRADRGAVDRPHAATAGERGSARARRRSFARLCRCCEHAIDPRRLKALPNADTCIDCQREFEGEIAP